jgi:hypothetical protein
MSPVDDQIHDQLESMSICMRVTSQESEEKNTHISSLLVTGVLVLRSSFTVTVNVSMKTYTNFYH